ncbi:hypothetical protein CYB_0670 [Synechococcus sp. JA-2-3B'a(2-13)]|nr:hypothetical protein CYB_0670 [Synechococcus sp. JA-2-3B'a(2-13)]
MLLEGLLDLLPILQTATPFSTISFSNLQRFREKLSYRLFQIPLNLLAPLSQGVRAQRIGPTGLPVGDPCHTYPRVQGAGALADPRVARVAPTYPRVQGAGIRIPGREGILTCCMGEGVDGGGLVRS